MESSTTYVALKDGFEVTLSKTDSELTIEAEDQGNGNTFSSKFSNDAIKSMAGGLFASIPEFYEGLLAVLDGSSEETKVKVSQEGKLMFTMELKIGNDEKVLSFEIPLKLIESDPVNRLEKQVKKLLREMEGLKKENRQFKEEIRHLKEKNGADPDYEIINPRFNPAGKHKDNFEISQDLKKITRKKIFLNSSCALGSSEMLSKEKNSKFYVKADGGYVMIGVGTREILEGWSCHITGSYGISSPNTASENGTRKNYSNYSNIAQGSIIGVLFIPSKGRVLFDVDGVHVYTAKVAQKHLEADLYPFVCMNLETVSASFL